MKRLFAAHPAILSIVVFAFIIDAVIVASTGGLWEDASFALGSVLVVAYFFGISLFLRFVVFRNRIHAGITWVATILICWGWFTLQVALDQRPYRPSFLFIMCLFAAFKTMRLERSEEEKNEAEQRLANNDSDADGSESDECEDQNDEHPVIGKKEEENAVVPPPPSPPSTKPTIVPDEVTNTSENQNSLRSLKQVLAIMAAIGCLIALWDMPDDYYKVLRFIVVAACGVIIWDVQKSSARDVKKTWITVGFGIIAALFNPIMPIDLEYERWLWARIAATILFTANNIRPVAFKKVTEWWNKNAGNAMAALIAVVWILIIIGSAIYSLFTYKKIIDDETASRYYAEIDTATGDDLQTKISALESWANSKKKEQERYKEYLYKVFTDFDKYSASEGLDAFDEESRYQYANRQFIAHQTGGKFEDQMFVYQSLRDKWTESVSGKKGTTEKETFHLIRNHLLGVGKATNSQVEIIDDATATRIYNEIDNATGDEREQMADALIAYGEKKAAEEYNATDEHFSKLFTDESYFEQEKRANAAVQESLDPDQTAKSAAIGAWLEHRMGRSIDTMSYQAERDAFAIANYGKRVRDDSEMFGLIRGEYEQQKIQRGREAYESAAKKTSSQTSKN